MSEYQTRTLHVDFVVRVHNIVVSNTAAGSDGASARGCSTWVQLSLWAEGQFSHEGGVVSSPKLHGQFVHRGLSLVRDGLSSLEKVSELLQLLQGVGQLPPHGLQLPFQHLDALHVVHLVRLAAVERLLQIDRCGQRRAKVKAKLEGSMQRQDLFLQN